MCDFRGVSVMTEDWGFAALQLTIPHLVANESLSYHGRDIRFRQ
jgi:hypothetical protein